MWGQSCEFKVMALKLLVQSKILCWLKVYKKLIINDWCFQLLKYISDNFFVVFLGNSDRSAW